eukprot:1622884-Rhodomonas_salina.1
MQHESGMDHAPREEDGEDLLGGERGPGSAGAADVDVDMEPGGRVADLRERGHGSAQMFQNREDHFHLRLCVAVPVLQVLRLGS